MTTPDLGHVAAAVEVAALDVDVAAALAAAGFPIDLTRPPTPAELASRTTFAAIDNDVRAAASELASLGRASRARALDLVAELLRVAPDAATVLRLVDSLAASTATLPGAAALAEIVEDVATARLDRLAADSLTQFVADARNAGITVPADDVDALRRVALRDQAHRLAAESIDAAVRAARGAAYTTPRRGPVAEFVDQLLRAAADTGTAALDDVASQAAIRAAGAGRMSGVDALAEATEPVTIYASELLDRNTCPPCANIDGEPMTRDQAYELYPDGRYVECKGGDRCRGTVIVVAGDERAATLPSPGDRAGNRTERYQIREPADAR